MANNFLEIVRKKLDTPDQFRLSASDRALLEQTRIGLEEIKQQRLSEAETLAELKELVQGNPEFFAGECSKLQSSFEETSKENGKIIEEALKKVGAAQAVAEKATLQAVLEETDMIENLKKRFSAVICLCVFSFLMSLGTLAVLILNILGII